MRVNCKHVWQYISDYIDDRVDPLLREEIELHLEHCELCSAILDSTRNILILIADHRMFALPIGFGDRLHARIREELDSASGGD